ncbi:hypothetical protein L1765_12140 [Microaerobacter geothermalis]|uniref:hypothetical protein n=1 Tax=Microaerobacter geothermalis TaxID=674972 RepID=UPI001F3800E4|nr:hypothetical protein [Microaerobacter geothermalis]MCF6094711.1 hypothetical protein [Microaerobacter geothermalis]
MSFYKPTVSEGIHPQDGGWYEWLGETYLALSVPEWKDIVNKRAGHYEYAWLFDKDQNAYIFCFRLADGTERAIIFQRDHAGLLLLESPAYEPFHIWITSEELQDVEERTPLLQLKDVTLDRSVEAKW